MKLALFIFFLPLLSARAESIALLGRKIDFIQIEQIKYSANCQKNCLAKAAVNAFLAKPFEVKAKTNFHSQAGSILCRDYWKEVSVIGVRPDKNQGAYCLFQDQSLVDLDSLSQKLRNK